MPNGLDSSFAACEGEWGMGAERQARISSVQEISQMGADYGPFDAADSEPLIRLDSSVSNGPVCSEERHNARPVAR